MCIAAVHVFLSKIQDSYELDDMWLSVKFCFDFLFTQHDDTLSVTLSQGARQESAKASAKQQFSDTRLQMAPRQKYFCRSIKYDQAHLLYEARQKLKLWKITAWKTNR